MEIWPCADEITSVPQHGLGPPLIEARADEVGFIKPAIKITVLLHRAGRRGPKFVRFKERPPPLKAREEHAPSHLSVAEKREEIVAQILGADVEELHAPPREAMV